VQTNRWSASRASSASEADVLQSLFVTPVSVKDDATSIAGHGIGLDSVRQSIARLGGEVSVASSSGRGTTFSLRLPLSTAVGSAMLFKVGSQTYAIPAVFVGQTVAVLADNDHVMIGDDAVPVLSLQALLGASQTESTPSNLRTALLVTYAGRSILATVDRVVGAREVVIKQLDPLLAPLTLYTGATISGSGKVQLILDPALLVRRGWAAISPIERQALSRPMDPNRSRRALVVDDSRAIREAMTSMLSREGWIVDVAEDGTRALAQMNQRGYELLVTDLEMPQLDGWGLIAATQQQTSDTHTDIIIITSRSNAENRRRARDMGVLALVTKPVTRRKLVDALSQLNPDAKQM
jgi:chemosensory pili system protein ChpA (sensor histidine kinase/response regulator)